MQYLDVNVESMAENLALDEALLNEADLARQTNRAAVSPLTNPLVDCELLRFWEATQFAVVVGRGTNVYKEIDVSACEEDGVPIYRRCSGGTSVVAGPGCLMYAVLIDCEAKPELRVVDAAHRYVMERMRDALRTLNVPVKFRGSCDLAIGERKFSGNALRCKRNFFLYHGTVLYDFPLERISKYLLTPPHQPDYRDGRSHQDFVRNFPADLTSIQSAIRKTWAATKVQTDWPNATVAELVEQRYSQSSWNLNR